MLDFLPRLVSHCFVEDREYSLFLGLVLESLLSWNVFGLDGSCMGEQDCREIAELPMTRDVWRNMISEMRVADLYGTSFE